MRKKLHTLQHGEENNVQGQMDLMCAKIGARLLAPSRCSELSAREEKVRCDLSWQQMDERIWIAGLSEFEELGNWVGDPQKFIENRENTWLIFSDQIPLWVKIGMLKVLYAAFEIEDSKKAVESKNIRKERQKKILASRGNESQRLDNEDEGEEKDPEKDDDAPGKKMGEGQGQSQKRGADSAGDKCRVTFEARQGLSGLFTGDPKKIKGHILDSIVVLKGQYAQLDNIDDDHKFIKR